MHYNEDYDGKKALILLGFFYISETFILGGRAPTFYIPSALI